MKDRPILFQGEMVRAILDGRKTQTRRLVKPQPLHLEWFAHQDGWCGKFRDDGGTTNDPAYRMVSCPYGVPGGRLWVRETWRYAMTSVSGCDVIQYRATQDGRFCDRHEQRLLGATAGRSAINQVHAGKWRPSIHMPRWASRITLEVTGVCVERVQDISDEDAKAKGCDCRSDLAWGNGGFDGTQEGPYDWAVYQGHRFAFQELWDSINSKTTDAAWSDNPWVWVVTFKKVGE